MATFSRLGARLVWAGACRGAVTDGLGVGRWDGIGLVHYPSRACFARLMRVPAYAASARFREASLGRSWVARCRPRHEESEGE